jgi:hypothetical protein
MQQPLEQVAELHVLVIVHVLFVHTSPAAVQLVQATPFDPHTVFDVPGLHVLPAQQPRQLEGPHVLVVLQTWLVQTSPEAVQLAHALPALPHWVFAVPGVHEPAEQQPEGQLEGPQPGVTHRPAEQIWPWIAQFMQSVPFVPHCALFVAVMQPLGEQHPFRQVAGPHAAAVHRPPAQVPPVAVQLTHAPPPMPHAALSLAGMHPPAWQHVEQLDGLHAELTHTPAEQVWPSALQL